MGLELNILGLRKLKDEEIKELTGKTQEEMRKSKYFRQFFPKTVVQLSLSKSRQQTPIVVAT